ncbi:pre-mRNA 3'-end-processing factor FIP1 isoform X2 [Schistocerca americana]|uniref:pre-mRNA 3'-end-processing factor FIP1 isoform X2 n=1 Tax=Schistocerca americana TaxID=7009 RepID=UPI001F4FB10A|nr:pre-mRNA 3'-end-processing factor FIP1 isoform X2 [Schistocerca americana]XP_049775373.1 pre-mRNA 3'-end-processing factor FIP1 isoform X2 [Schistocerca cancellata]XP_049801109.1 pre-mRNA 3'-end-processing factor FIP1 isoform X2 [Schistocerca nitens]XP_049950965.1 pre-mRNA 3'-end-processing factor FIP1 isoform X2 [Schistocerca serialis cubense]
MADDSGNEDQWLYGDSNQDAPERDNKTDPKDVPDAVHNTDSQIDTLEDLGDQPLPAPEPPTIAPPEIKDGEEDSELNIAEGEGAQISREQGEVDAEGAVDGKETENGIIGGVDDDDEDEDSDDDVQVVIGDIKTSPTYTSLNIKRGGLLTSAVGGEKLKQPGKFSIEEFEAIGTINGVPAHEFNLDSLEDKPWRKPGADITDYFNYGFNEETWRAYCERQKRIRIHESGVGLAQIGSTTAGRGAIPVAITNDNSKYSGFMGPKKAGPPPGRKMGGTIDVIGGGGLASRRNLEKGTPPKENVIQVMTADRREYSRKPPFPDMTVPPPTTIPPAFELPPPPHGVIPPVPTSFPPPPPPHIEPYGSEFYTPEADPYYQSYEPTQDSQWNDPTWQPTPVPVASDVKVLTPSPMVSHLPPVISASSGGLPPETASQDSRSSLRDHGDDNASVAGGRAESITKDSSEKEPRERTRDKDRDKSERHRDRSHRHRSRSRSTEKRSRRHKSRSRSPGHRSHRKKKSRRSDREKSKEESE